MKSRTGSFVAVAASLIVSGCVTAQEHLAAVKSDDGERLTVGTVQREIRVGMSGAEVATTLGSPNIVSTDEDGREVWIYDKISTDRVYSRSTGGVSALILGGALVGNGLIGGAVGPSYSSSAGQLDAPAYADGHREVRRRQRRS